MDEGFQKIDLTKPIVVEPKSDGREISSEREEAMKKKKQKTFFKRKRGFFAIFLVLIITCGLTVAIPGWTIFTRAKETHASAKLLVKALKNQNLPQAKTALAQTKEGVRQTKASTRYLSWIKFIPLVGIYYRDFQHGLTAAEAGLEALEISLDAIEPYADLLGFKGKGTFTAGSANERIQTAVATFDKVTPRLAEISTKVEVVQKEIDAIDPNQYPVKLGDFKVRNKLIQGKALIKEAATLFLSARPLLERLPKIMGHKEPATYLVFFKNDKELRPDGGFITAYAIFRFESGKPIVEKADDIYKLDKSRTRRVGAPPEILKYHKEVYYFHLRDSNLSPDFVESIKLFEELYQDVPGKIDYDGIIAVDTHVLVEAMKILGTFVVYDRTFSAENDPRCDCPRVVYELEDYATRPVAYVREERKDIIGVLLLQILQKALGVSPSQYWGQLFQMGIKELNEKHILLYLKDTSAQQAIEELGWGGRLRQYPGDYLHVNDANMAGAKSDLFVQRSAKVEYSIDDNGDVTKTLTLGYKNPAPPSNCNLEAGELCLNGLLRNWLRIYVPKGSQLLEFKGSEMDPVVKEDLGKTVFEGFLTVKPLGASQIVVSYKLPAELRRGKVLPVLIQKQPGTDGHQYEIIVNGKTIEQFTLRTDRELEVPLD